jgi:putative LysE/RhtB family amino acid efflux pump
MAGLSLRDTLRAGPSVVARPEERRPGGLATAFMTMVALTATNPATILSFAALFASIGAGTGGPTGAMLVVAGVFTGSISWWAILTGSVAALRARLTPGIVRGLNLLSGIVIGGFGLVAMGLGVVG